MVTVLTAGFLSGLGMRQLARILLVDPAPTRIASADHLSSPCYGLRDELLGQTAILGLALAHNRLALPFLSSLLGWVGVFLTGSDTSSNACRESASSDRFQTSFRSGVDGRRQFRRRRDGKDDQFADHRRSDRRHWRRYVPAIEALPQDASSQLNSYGARGADCFHVRTPDVTYRNRLRSTEY